MKILNVVGARPNFMKIAAILKAFKQRPSIQALLLHTGQHSGREMSASFFKELNLPRPDFYLDIGRGNATTQMARVMVRFERVLEHERPDLVLVVGDVTSTLACALVAQRHGVPLAHVEAGLRSFDRTMPEEINRRLTDALSDYLFTTCEDANHHLIEEGIPAERIHFVGNVMADTLLSNLNQITQSGILDQLGLNGDQYVVITLHRPSNVDDPRRLAVLCRALSKIQKAARIIFPIHPRTRSRLIRFGLMEKLIRYPGLVTLRPLGYLDFIQLLRHARVVLTDSGGVQEEATILGIPCLTLRGNTERPVTIWNGSNHLVGRQSVEIVEETLRRLGKRRRRYPIPPLWDGYAAKRIVSVLTRRP